MDKHGDGLLLGNTHINLRKNVDGREAGRMEGRKMMKKKTMKKMGETLRKNKDQTFT